MSSKISLALLTAALCTMAGCASVAPVARNSHPSLKNRELVLAKAREAPEMRNDEPAEAQAFFLQQRLPAGATELDYSKYATAEAQASKLPWYSLSQNRVLGHLQPDQAAELSTWQPLGPGNVGGRTRVLRFHPDNPNIMFIAGVAGGLWKSTNGGASWLPLTDLAPNLAIVSMVIDSDNPQRMWVGTGEGVFNGDAVQGAGIFFSANGGLDWSQLQSTNNANFAFVNDLIQSPNDPDQLYAATAAGVFRSPDAGATWEQVIDTTPGDLDMFGGCFSLVRRDDIGPADTILAACGTFGFNSNFSAETNGAVFRNTDAAGAGTWTSVLSPTNMGRTSLAVAPSNSLVMYALVAGGEQATAGPLTFDGLLGVWRSDDGGATWSVKVQNDNTLKNKNLLLSNPIEAYLTQCFGSGGNLAFNQGWYDNVIRVDPVNPDRVWVGGIDLWRSDDQGANWGVASYWWFFPTDAEYAHADNHGIFFHPDYDGATNKRMIVTSDGGVFKTDDATAAVGTVGTIDANNSVCGDVNKPLITWSNLNNGYAVTQFWPGAVFPDGKTYFAGSQDNGTNIGDDASGQNAWVKILGGDGGYSAVDPNNTQVLYAENTGFSLKKSTNGGASFASALSGVTGDGGLFTTPFLMDQNDSTRLWIGGSKLWRTGNSAGSWVQAANDALPGTRKFSAFAVPNYFPNLLAAGVSTGRVYMVPNATTRTSADLLPGFSVPTGYISWLQFDPTETFSNLTTRTLIATSTVFGLPHVLRSDDSGATWTEINGTSGAELPDIPVDCVAIDPTTADAQRIFVGTDIGVFVTTDGGQTWNRENTGFANTRVSNLVIQRDAASGKMVLYAFTHGRGLYKTTFTPGDYIYANGVE
jgi:photosystem II stability/assembly factor-like uncharacterized protein